MARSFHVAWVIVVGAFAGSVNADVRNMGGTRNADGSWTGLASLETVTVGNPGNVGELSGPSVSTWSPAPDRICGSVAYTYNIGKYEVTAGQYTEFLNAVARTDTYGLYNTDMWSSNLGCKIQQNGISGNYTYSVAADYANRPVTYVSFWDSCRFSNWLHNDQPTGLQDAGTTETGAYTLTTDGMNNNTVTRNGNAKWAVANEDEWYKAAYYDPNKPGGAGYWDYPTRSDTYPGRDMDDVSGNNANYWFNGFLIGSPYWRTEVGEFQNSASPYGTFDQDGNVWELNESILDDGYRCVRGGAYDGMPQAPVAWIRSYNQSSYEIDYVGFRVVEVPEPTTMALLSFGGLALIRRKRR